MNKFVFKCLLFVFALNLMAIDCQCQERVLEFPTGWKHANLFIYENPKQSATSGILDFDWSGKNAGVAVGKAILPANAFVGLEINGVDGLEKFLSSLPSEGIQRIVLLNAALTNDTFQQIERISSLRQVVLVNCTAEQVDIKLLKGLPRLQYLQCRQKRASSEMHNTMAAWAAKSPQLQFFYDGAPLDLEEVRQFKGHQVPLFISVGLNEDAAQTLDALSMIPDLIGMNVHVSTNVPEGYEQSLDKLKRLRIVNWNGGTLDENLASSLGRLDKLKKLRVQGDAQLRDSFIDNLGQLHKIEAISFNIPLTEYQKEKLTQTLLDLKYIRELPELSKVTATQLDRIVKRRNIRTLRISGLNEGASIESLVKAIEANREISELWLRNVNWTPELAKAICECTELDYLRLDVEDFDGNFFSRVDQLRSLRSISLRVRGRAYNLDTLGQFPKLQSVQISLNTFDPNHWSFVADSKSLRSLVVLDGHCDDRMVKWIVKSESLRNFETHQSGVMTDGGVLEIAQCQQLESVAIEGFITEQAIQQMKKLPNLRRLLVSTDSIGKDLGLRLKSQFANLEYFSLRPFRPASGKIVIGPDACYRQIPNGGREKLDQLEGSELKEMLGDAYTEQLHNQLAGKVVLVEFWGTWCGPCLNFLPELTRLHEKYAEHGFEILAIHSKAGAETVDQYLKENPRPWLNLVDRQGTFQNSFAVPSFPSTYVFGADGKMQVALPFRNDLGQPLERLMKDAR